LGRQIPAASTRLIALTSTNGFAVTSAPLAASGYFNVSAAGFHVGTPFPVTQNFTMGSSGVVRNITIATDPAGLAISVDGTSYVAPHIFQWNPSNAHTIATSTPQAATAGTQYAFSSWSDSGELSHSITVPNADTTYTASFNTQYQLTTAPIRRREDPLRLAVGSILAQAFSSRRP
jgi:hypothetical protein